VAAGSYTMTLSARYFIDEIIAKVSIISLIILCHAIKTIAGFSHYVIIISWYIIIDYSLENKTLVFITNLF